jgi:hypothetical protein
MSWHPTYLLRESFSFLSGNETGFISTSTPLPPPKKGLAKAKKPLKVRRHDMGKMKQAFPGHITTVQTLAERSLYSMCAQNCLPHVKDLNKCPGD